MDVKYTAVYRGENAPRRTDVLWVHHSVKNDLTSPIVVQSFSKGRWVDAYDKEDQSDITRLTEQLGDITTLETTAQDSVVNAINEVVGNTGDLDDLTTTEKTTLVGAINEAATSGDPASLLYTAQTLTDEQKAQARTNMGAASEDEVGGDINEPHTGLTPKLHRGLIASGGSITESDAYMYTEPIFGDFFMELNDGFRIYAGHIYDREGNIVSYQHINPDVNHSGSRGTWSSRTFFSTENTVPEYGLRLVICKSDSTDIADGESIVKKFVSLQDAGLHRWCPDGLQNYGIAIRRLNYVQHLRWTPSAKVPDGYGNGVANNYFCLANQLQIGVPYSDVAETRKYVPNNVSIRTFMTALKNKRSLIYTEELQEGVSKYGMTYQGGNRRAYYGSACSAMTAWVMGLKTIYLTDSISTIPGLSVVTPVTASAIQPLDLYLKADHVCMVTDVLKDDCDELKYIVLAEMSTPYPYRTIYTPEQFMSRLSSDSASIYRWANWSSIDEPEDTSLVQYCLGDTLQNISYNEDIMCFAGDYACFAEGDAIYLNARRNSQYTDVKLYKDDSLLQTIDITGLSADTILATNTEDWVVVNLTSLNLSAGKYKACLTDGANVTDYTYFEVLGMTLSATVSENNIIVTFSSTGTPLSIEQCQTSGFEYRLRTLDSTDISAGTVTLAWNYAAYYPMLYLVARGDYGTAVKRISFPQ